MTPKIKAQIEDLAMYAGGMIEAWDDLYADDDDKLPTEQHVLAAIGNAWTACSAKTRMSYILATQSICGVELTDQEEAQIEEADSGPAADSFHETLEQHAKEKFPVLWLAIRLNKEKSRLEYEIRKLLSGR